jgi:hypothetical protein
MTLPTSQTGSYSLKDAKYRLAAHVCIRTTGSNHVLLDLKRDRYYLIALGIPHLQALARREPIQLTASVLSESWVQPLLHAGLLEPDGFSDTIDFTSTTIDEPCIPSDIPHAYHRLPHRRDIKIFAQSLAWARWMLRTQSFYRIALYFQMHRQIRATNEFDTESTLALVSRFRQIRPWAFASKNQCLLHTLTLVKFSLSHGLHASWVIGFMTQPWGAHSWAQYGTMVLDGNPEQVRPYRPILVV